jgi:hypothetical protein
MPRLGAGQDANLHLGIRGTKANDLGGGTPGRSNHNVQPVKGNAHHGYIEVYS